MDTITQILPWIQIVLSLLLILAIIAQQSGDGLGSAFGGEDSGGVRNTRRGAEKFLYRAAIVLAILFAVTAVLAIAQ